MGWRRRGGAGEKLKDVFTDHSFIYVSKIDGMCDKVGVQQEVSTGGTSSVDDSEPMVIELSEGVCAEAASEPSAVGSKDIVRLCIACKTKDQGGGRI